MPDAEEIRTSGLPGRPEDEAFYRDAISIFGRFIVLANAGAVVAVLSFIATAVPKFGPLAWYPMVPLVFFSLGTVAAGNGLRAVLKEAASRRKAGIYEDKGDSAKAKAMYGKAGQKGEEATGWFTGSTWCFLAGVLSGLIFLGFYLIQLSVHP